LRADRGIGYWIWKVYAIWVALGSLDVGDVLVYMDSDIELVNDPQKLICLGSNSASGIVPFILPRGCCMERTYTKRDAFVLVGAHHAATGKNNPGSGDTRQAADTTQHNANVWVFRKTKESVAFVKEWLELVQDPRVVTDDKSTLGPDYEAFKEHRHDQSVSSLLVKQWGLKPFTPPDTFSREYFDTHYNTHLAPESGLGLEPFSDEGMLVDASQLGSEYKDSDIRQLRDANVRALSQYLMGEEKIAEAKRLGQEELIDNSNGHHNVRRELLEQPAMEAPSHYDSHYDSLRGRTGRAVPGLVGAVLHGVAMSAMGEAEASKRRSKSGCADVVEMVCSGLAGKECVECAENENHVMMVLDACQDQATVDAACGGIETKSAEPAMEAATAAPAADPAAPAVAVLSNEVVGVDMKILEEEVLKDNKVWLVLYRGSDKLSRKFTGADMGSGENGAWSELVGSLKRLQCGFVDASDNKGREVARRALGGDSTKLPALRLYTAQGDSGQGKGTVAIMTAEDLKLKILRKRLQRGIKDNKLQKDVNGA
jgi:hypothetical protein